MNWPVLKLGDLASREPGAIKTGPFGSQLKKFELVPSGVHVVGIENVLNKRFDGFGDRYITKEKFESLRSIEVRPGDVLITRMGTIGEVAVVPDGTSASIMDFHLMRFRPNSALCSPNYVAWLIKGGSSTKSALHGRAHGAIMKGLNSSIIKSLPAPLPPPSEQRLIVEILDQANELARKRAEADRKAVDILAALYYKLFGDPITNSMGWKTSPLGQEVKSVSGGTPSSDSASYWSGDIPWVSPKDMRDLVIRDTEDHISKEAIQNSATNLVPEHSVLIVFRSGILVRTVPVAITARALAINQDIKGLIPTSNDVSPWFLLGWLIAAKSLLMSCVKKGATVQSIDTGRFESLSFPLPPVPLQEKFTVLFKSQLDDREKRKLLSSKTNELLSLIFHRAFTGRLTIKWREAHMKEVLAEMEQQAKLLNLAKEAELC